MCDRVIVLEEGRLGFDGAVDAGIKYLQYDTDDGPEDNEDDELGADGLDARSADPGGRRSCARSRPLDKSPALRRVEWKLQVCSYSDSLAVTSVTGVKLATRVTLPHALE